MKISSLLSMFGRNKEILAIPNQYRVLQRLINNPRPVVIDGGAHRGETLDYIKKVFPDSNIFCFEPCRDSFGELCVVARNYRNVTVEKLALSDTSGSAFININLYEQTNSLLKTAPEAIHTWGENLLENQGNEKIEITTLDEYCQTNGIKYIDILKLDLQGSEIKALSGSKTMLSEKKIGYITLEIILANTYIEQPSIDEYFTFLCERGYSLIGINNPISKNDRLLQADFLFELTP